MKYGIPGAGRRAAVAITLAVPVLAGPAVAQDEPTLSLDEAVQAALRHSPQMAQAEGALQNAAWGERTAWGAFLPSLSFSTGGSRSSQTRFNPQTNTSVQGSSDSYSAGLSSSIELFSGGRRFAQMRQAQAQTATAQASLIEQRFAVTLAAKNAFFNVLRAEDLIRVAEVRIQNAQEGLDAATQRAQVGSATRSDVLRSGLELTNARQALLQARNQRRTAAYALGRLVGVEGPVGARLDAPLQPAPLGLSREEIRALALEQAPSVRTADLAVDAAVAGERAARAQYFPSVSASAGYDWFNDSPQVFAGRKSWGLRLSISYPLFNRFQREDAVSRASVQSDIARVQLEDARRLVLSELESVLGALELAEQQIALAEEAVLAAEEDLRVQDERYRLGVSTILDRVTSQVNLVQAEIDLIAARYDYQIARAELEALIGREL